MTETVTTAGSGMGIKRLIDVGAHFAQVKSRRHPSMRAYVLGAKGGVEIFDLAKTEAQIAEAKKVLEALSRDGKTVLFVGGKREASDAVRAIGKRLGQPFVASRWLGGTLTNFTEIKKRIDRLADLTAKRDSGELSKLYTKLERIYIDREITRLSERLEGIVNLTKRPDAVVIVDTKHDAHATKEARQLNIPIIAIISSDCNLADATYPIVTNDASRGALSLILTELGDAFEAGYAK